MKQVFLVLAIILSINSFGQNPNDNLITLSPGVTNIKEIKPKPQKTKGSHYYRKDWNIGTIKLFSGKIIENYPLKYDLKMNQIDIKVENEIKVLSVGAVKQISWFTSNGIEETLVNFIMFDKDKHGLVSVICNGKVPLLKSTSLKIQEANYNTAMDVGNRGKKYIITKEYFTVIDGKIKKVRKKKRQIKKIFNDKASIVEKYAEEKNLSFKKDYDLAKIFNYYNSL